MSHEEGRKVNAEQDLVFGLPSIFPVLISEKKIMGRWNFSLKMPSGGAKIKKEAQMRKGFLIFFAISLLVSCSKGRVERRLRASYSQLKVVKIRKIQEKEIGGHFLGANFKKMEMYLVFSPPRSKTFRIAVYDLKDLVVKREIEVEKGPFEFPKVMGEPFYMDFAGGRYFLVDLASKTFVYDSELNFLYPVMLHELQRYFMDFFHKDGEYFFFIGKKKRVGEMNEISGEIYKILPDRKPKRIKKLVRFLAKDNYYKGKEGDKRIYTPVLWTTPFGFEKEGKLYYFYGEKREYFYYDLETGKKTVVLLDYLPCRKYTEKEVEELWRAFRIENVYTRWFASHHYRYIIEPYPLPVCFFTIYDVGEGKIGVISTVDIKGRKYRMDVLRAEDGKYLQSIWFPITNVFLMSLKTYHGQFPYRNAINLDLGIYIYQHWDNEREMFVTRVLKFQEEK